MHFGTGPDSMNVIDLDPYVLDEHLCEIEICARRSRSVFFLVSIRLLSPSRAGHRAAPRCLLNNFNSILIRHDKNVALECLIFIGPRYYR